MTESLSAGAAPQAPKPPRNNLVANNYATPPTNIASEEHTPPSQASSSIEGSTISDGDTPFDKASLIFAHRAIPLIARSAALFALGDLDPRRTVTKVKDGFHVNRTSNSEAWVAQHVGEEAASPCTNCSKGRAAFPGQACVVWRHLLFALEKVRSTEESVEAAADGTSVPQEKGKRPAPHAPARITRVRFCGTESPPRSSQTISRGRAMSPVRATSPAPEPRVVSPLRSRPRLPTPDESLKGMYDWELRLARMQSRKARIASRRQHEVAVAAIIQVEVEEEEAKRRERGRNRVAASLYICNNSYWNAYGYRYLNGKH
ncbi:hypothetical protein VE00_03606 [Pseudogymnoascus sp. WSF 3629]|nr:hypothetical protein VE00_03606 [Pseudogymnoascus sp. WSF 3629]